MSDALRAELARVASRLGGDGVEFVLERPRDAGHGDLATNLAMVLAKRERANPAEDRRAGPRGAAPLARARGQDRDRRAGVHQLLAGAGPARRRAPDDPRRRAGSYGRSTAGAGLKVNVEFVSANPTGPLHVGHGRGAALGDAIAALLEWTGHAVTREFYINDAGVQIDRVAESLWARVREPAGHAGRRFPRAAITASTCARTRVEVLEQEGPPLPSLPAEEGIRRSRALALASSAKSRTATSPSSACGST